MFNAEGGGKQMKADMSEAKELNEKYEKMSQDLEYQIGDLKRYMATKLDMNEPDINAKIRLLLEDTLKSTAAFS